ncbi:MAG: hypothetical protein ACOCYO_05960 [Bacteroidota bacterium]
MRKKQLYIFLFVLIVIFSCQRNQSSLNLAQKDNPDAQKLIALGLGTMGVIHSNQIYVHFLNENNEWVIDENSQFTLPEKNQGVISMGMGVIGVVEENTIFFYYLDAENKWVKDDEVTYSLPEDFLSISAMRMNWELGMLALEQTEKVIDFFYLDEFGKWKRDETARFVLPVNIDNYVVLGEMEVAIIQDQRLGVYNLNNIEAKWEFDENMVLKLPDDFQAVISFEPGTIGVLDQNRVVKFYEKDSQNQVWVLDESMNFYLDDFYQSLAKNLIQ